MGDQISLQRYLTLESQEKVLLNIISSTEKLQETTEKPMASGQERRAVTLQSNETWNLQAHIGGKTKTTDIEKNKTKSSL